MCCDVKASFECIYNVALHRATLYRVPWRQFRDPGSENFQFRRALMLETMSDYIRTTTKGLLASVVFTTFLTLLPLAGKRVEVSRRLRERVAVCLNRVVSISVTI